MLQYTIKALHVTSFGLLDCDDHIAILVDNDVAVELIYLYVCARKIKTHYKKQTLNKNYACCLYLCAAAFVFSTSPHAICACSSGVRVGAINDSAKSPPTFFY